MIVLVPSIVNELAGGGGDRIRTRDPQLAKLVLYQLSYAPLVRGEQRCRHPEDVADSRAATGPPLRVTHPTIQLRSRNGGPEWIRTTYLALIRRVL